MSRRPALGYSAWLRAVCALLGLGPTGREALASMMHGAWADGATPAQAAAGLREWLAGEGPRERPTAHRGGRPVSGKVRGT